MRARHVLHLDCLVEGGQTQRAQNLYHFLRTDSDEELTVLDQVSPF